MYIYAHMQIDTLLLRSTPFYGTATDVTPPGVTGISGGKNVQLYAHTVQVNDHTSGDNTLSKVRDSKIGNY